jgi:streptomycin 6-kinase
LSPVALPTRLNRIADLWQLSHIEPFDPDNSRGGTELIARALSDKHGEVVLKYAADHPRLPAEIATLTHFKGKGAVRVFEQDPDNGVYLMQALDPGRQLSALCREGHDDDATQIVAKLIGNLPKVQSGDLPAAIPPVESLLVHFDRFRDSHPARDDIHDMVSAGEKVFRTMLSQPFDPVVLHGDLHHFNILEHGDNNWVAIDPHGYTGPPIFEVGAMMKNPWPDILDAPDLTALMTRRISILADVLGWPAEAITRSAFVYVVISLLWDMELNDRPGAFVPVAECLWALNNQGRP